MNLKMNAQARENHLVALEQATSSFTKSINNMTQILSSIHSYVQVNNHNRANLKKASFKNIDNMINLTNEVSYTDIVKNSVTNVEETYRIISTAMKKLKKSISSNASSGYLMEALDAIAVHETELSRMNENFVNSGPHIKQFSDNLTASLTKFSSNPDAMIILDEPLFTTYLKLECIIQNMLPTNQGLKDSWRIICEPVIFSIITKYMQQQTANLFVEFKKKYDLDTFTTKYDVYYFLYEDLPTTTTTTPSTRTTSSFSRVKLTSTVPDYELLWNVCGDEIGDILNMFLMQNSVAIKNLIINSSIDAWAVAFLRKNQYPLKPIKSGSILDSNYFSKPFHRNSTMLCLAAGDGIENYEVVGRVGSINDNTSMLSYNAHGEFTIRPMEDMFSLRKGLIDDIEETAEEKRERGGCCRKRTIFDASGDSIRDAKRGRMEIESTADTHYKLYDQLKRKLVRVQSLTQSLSRFDNSFLTNFINIDYFLEIHPKILENSVKFTDIAKSSDLKRAKNHLKVLASRSDSAYINSIDMFKKILDASTKRLDNAASVTGIKKTLDPFIKSQVLVNVINKINSLVSSSIGTCSDKFIIKINIYGEPPEELINYFTTNGKVLTPIWPELEQDFTKLFSPICLLKQQKSDQLNNKFTQLQTCITKFEIKELSFYDEITEDFKIKIFYTRTRDEFKVFGKSFTEYITKQTMVTDINFFTEGEFLSSFKPFVIRPIEKDFFKMLYCYFFVSIGIIPTSWTFEKINPSLYVFKQEDAFSLSKNEQILYLMLTYFMTRSQSTNLFTNIQDTRDYLQELNDLWIDVKSDISIESDIQTEELDTSKPINIVDLLQQTGLDLVYTSPCNICINPIGPSGSGKSVFVFGRQNSSDGILQDMLKMNNVTNFQFCDWRATAFRFKESVLTEVNTNASIRHLYYDTTSADLTYKMDKMFKITDEYGINIGRAQKFQTDLVDFKNGLFPYAAVTETLNNKASSRTFSLVIVKVKIDNIEYFKILFDTPGTENIISAENVKDATDVDLKFVLNPTALLIEVFQNEYEPVITDMSTYYPALVDILFNQLDSPTSLVDDTDNVLPNLILYLKNSIVNYNTIESTFNFSTIKYSDGNPFEPLMVKILNNIGINSLDTVIDKGIWNVNIGPDVSSFDANTGIAYYGVAKSLMPLHEFFQMGTLLARIKKTSNQLTFKDLLNPFWGACSSQFIKQQPKTFVFKGYQAIDKNHLIEYQLFPYLNNTQALIHLSHRKVIVFMAMYVVWKLEKFMTLKNFVNTFTETTYLSLKSDQLGESIVINEVANHFIGNPSSSIHKNNFSSPNTFASQLYTAALLFRDLYMTDAGSSVRLYDQKLSLSYSNELMLNIGAVVCAVDSINLRYQDVASGYGWTSQIVGIDPNVFKREGVASKKDGLGNLNIYSKILNKQANWTNLLCDINQFDTFATKAELSGLKSATHSTYADCPSLLLSQMSVFNICVLSPPKLADDKTKGISNARERYLEIACKKVLGKVNVKFGSLL